VISIRNQSLLPLGHTVLLLLDDAESAHNFASARSPQPGF